MVITATILSSSLLAGGDGQGPGGAAGEGGRGGRTQGQAVDGGEGEGRLGVHPAGGDRRGQGCVGSDAREGAVCGVSLLDAGHLPLLAPIISTLLASM